MLNGSRLRLRPWQESDLPSLTALRNDLATQSQLLARARGNRQEDVRAWLVQSSDDRLIFVIADLTEDAPLGYLQIVGLDLVDGRAELGICLAPEARGHGLGGEAVGLAMTYLRNVWHLRKLVLRVRADNTAAIHCYEKLGFARCGLLQAHVWADGDWRDVALMESLLGAA